MKCPRCERNVDDRAKECPWCGVVFRKLERMNEKPIQRNIPQSVEHIGIINSILKAWMIAAILLLISALLLVIGLWGFAEVQAEAGIIMAIFGPFIVGFIWMKGKCPHCGVEVQGRAPGFNCPACKQRIVVKDKRFSAVSA